jgi:hypothetical protein
MILMIEKDPLASIEMSQISECNTGMGNFDGVGGHKNI